MCVCVSVLCFKWLCWGQAFGLVVKLLGSDMLLLYCGVWVSCLAPAHHSLSLVLTLAQSWPFWAYGKWASTWKFFLFKCLYVSLTVALSQWWVWKNSPSSSSLKKPALCTWKYCSCMQCCSSDLQEEPGKPLYTCSIQNITPFQTIPVLSWMLVPFSCCGRIFAAGNSGK